MRPRVIGLAGAKRAGKDTVADALVTRGYIKHGFADALKAEVQARFPRTLDLIRAYECGWEGPGHVTLEALFDMKPPLLRAFLQEYGTEVRRADDPTYWLKRWVEGRPKGPVVVPDVRFYNEYRLIQEQAGGVVWFVVRPGVIREGHDSELDLADLEAEAVRDMLPGARVIHNNGTIEALGPIIDRLLEGP